MIKVRKMVTSGLEGSYWPKGGMRRPSEMMGSYMILGSDNTCVFKKVIPLYTSDLCMLL